jgi:hypothetical protein
MNIEKIKDFLESATSDSTLTFSLQPIEAIHNQLMQLGYEHFYSWSNGWQMDYRFFYKKGERVFSVSGGVFYKQDIVLALYDNEIGLINRENKWIDFSQTKPQHQQIIWVMRNGKIEIAQYCHAHTSIELERLKKGDYGAMNLLKNVAILLPSTSFRKAPKKAKPIHWRPFINFTSLI